MHDSSLIYTDQQTKYSDQYIKYLEANLEDNRPINVWIYRHLKVRAFPSGLTRRGSLIECHASRSAHCDHICLTPAVVQTILPTRI